MKLVLAGASGFLGKAWRDHLAREGHDVVRLVRGESLAASESSWDPYADRVDPALNMMFVQIWLFGLYLSGFESELFNNGSVMWFMTAAAIIGLRLQTTAEYAGETA